MILSLRTLALGVSLALAQAPTASAPSAATTTFHSDSMKLEFAYPSSFHGGEGEDTSKTEGAETGCFSLPVAVMDMRKEFNMIFLKRYDTSCLGRDGAADGLGKNAAKALNGSLEKFGKPALTSGIDYEVAGHKASMVFGSATARGAKGKNTIFGLESCVATGKNNACFEFLSNECGNIATLAGSTVTFTDGMAAPVLPAKLAPACKL